MRADSEIAFSKGNMESASRKPGKPNVGLLRPARTQNNQSGPLIAPSGADKFEAVFIEVFQKFAYKAFVVLSYGSRAYLQQILNGRPPRNEIKKIRCAKDVPGARAKISPQPIVPHLIE